MTGPRPVPVVLSEAERQVLERWARGRNTAQGLALRSKIVLACAQGSPNTQVAGDLRVSRATVIKWRSRFLAQRLDGLSDAPRPGAPRRITDEQAGLIIAKTLAERGPGKGARWTTRSLADATGISQSTVSRIWRACGISSHGAGQGCSSLSTVNELLTRYFRESHWSQRHA